MDKNMDIIELNLQNIDLDNTNISEDQIDLLIQANNEIPIFKESKKKKKWKLNETRKIIQECNKKKKNIIRNDSKYLKNIELNSKDLIKDLESVHKKTLNKLKDIENILDILKDNCIESYEN